MTRRFLVCKLRLEYVRGTFQPGGREEVIGRTYLDHETGYVLNRLIVIVRFNGQSLGSTKYQM